MTQTDPSVWTPPTVPEWEYPKETTERLEWADLSTIDLTSFNEPSGKKALAEQLSQAIQKDGFFAVVGHGISKDEVKRQFALGKTFFESQSNEVKRQRVVDFDDGDYFGYKAPFEKTMFGTDVKENVELLNVPKFNGFFDDDVINRIPYLNHFRSEIESFSRKSFEVARKLFVLFAIILELPENYFADQHRYEDYSDDHLRYMLYHPRPAEDDAKLDNNWARGHTDFGSLTLLFSQVVAGLQIRTETESGYEWKHIRPVDGGIICNIADALGFYSNNYLKSTVHRVLRPPDDQVGSRRLGLFYFVRPGKGSQIEIAPSPVLKKLGLYRDLPAVSGQHYVRSRVKQYHTKTTYDRNYGEKFRVGDFEIIDGYE
ncbi:unnamed protein product [Kuraishia capsulata CBS 1993]|uniref:Fe2OG dioxygenase domain-containing protein n=1 Tax=Kuraishia capsulata CBS 1993 TaxID=1382522 RepID=W6MFG1_9ASCO|nr:uncharacterized protein KUCA_T00000023001 [Kuraishia capsulata CBS 1993]CDK24063.1 unnamed protein product [Kuraishia capsulata CBS 1993]